MGAGDTNAALDVPKEGPSHEVVDKSGCGVSWELHPGCEGEMLSPKLTGAPGLQKCRNAGTDQS